MATEAPLRVLFVHHAEMIGGAAASLRCLLDYLPGDRVRAALLSPTVSLAAPLSAPALEAHFPAPWWDVRLSPNPLTLLGQAASLGALIRRLRQAVAQFRPNVIHANTWPAAIAATRARLPVPVIWHVRDVRIRPPITAALEGRCEGAIAISRFVADFLYDRHFPPDRVHIVYNGVDVERFGAKRPPGDVRLELGLAPDAPLVCSVARPAPWKEHGLLVEAAALLLRDFPAAHFLFVGAWGPRERRTMDRLRTRARKLGLERSVTFWGHRDDVPDLLAACDVFWHAAADEPLGRVVLEAMWMARPVVAVNAGGPAELVQHERTGLLVSPHDAGALAEGVRRMLSEPDLARSCGIAARERVLEHFTADRMARGILAVYERVLRGHVR